MLLPFVTSPYISRVLGAENLGIYSYTYSIVNVFVLFINLGIEKYGSRLVATVRDDREKLDEVFSQIFTFKLILGGIVITIFEIVITIAFNYKLYFFIQGALLLSAMLDSNWFFFGIEKFKITVIRNFVFKIITVCNVFLFVKTENDLWLYVTIVSFGSAISQCAVLSFLKKYVTLRKVTIKGAFKHLKPSMILFVAVLANSAYTYVDKIMIGAMATMEELGFCENAYKVISFPMGVITSLGVVMLPRMSKLYNLNDEEKANSYIKTSMEVVLILSIGMMFGISAISKDFATWFWGMEFEKSGQIIAFISPIVVFMSISDVIRNQYLIPRNKDKEYTLAIIIGATVNFGLNALLIPRNGAIGAAIATVFSYLSIMLYQMYVTRNEIPYISFLKNVSCYLIAGIMMYMLVMYIGTILEVTVFWKLIIQVSLGMIMYGILVVLILFMRLSRNGTMI